MTTELAALLASSAPADLGPGPRSGVMSAADIKKALGAIPLDEQPAESLRALVLLWHDHHEPAHEIAQAIEDADGSYVHAILHRREPDDWNAKYWFRRVGSHPAYAELGRRVAELLKAGGDGALASTIVPGGRWDPMAFVDACEAAAGGTKERQSVLREVQRIEFEVLAEHLLRERPGKGR